MLLCSICLCEDNEQYVETPCNHRFHTDCLYSWMNISRTCPCCRENLVCNNSANKILAQVSSTNQMSINLSDATITIPIYIQKYKDDTSFDIEIEFTEYLDVYNITSINMNDDYKDRDSNGWKFIKALMPHNNLKKYLHISDGSNGSTKKTFTVIEELSDYYNVHVISNIFKDVWSHELLFEN